MDTKEREGNVPRPGSQRDAVVPTDRAARSRAAAAAGAVAAGAVAAGAAVVGAEAVGAEAVGVAAVGVAAAVAAAATRAAMPRRSAAGGGSYASTKRGQASSFDLIPRRWVKMLGSP